MRQKPHLLLCIALCIPMSLCSDITTFAFGSRTDVMPAAFGDFNSDELTDLFVISNNGYSVEILIASTKEMYFTTQNYKCNHTNKITSVVPGDFDGDALMDVLVTVRDADRASSISNVFIHWGANSSINCTSEPILQTIDEPLVIDHHADMIPDLFGIENGTQRRTIWTFYKNRTKSIQYLSLSPSRLRIPHSHAFLDLNEDNAPDLFLTGEWQFEIWLWDATNETFVFSKNISYPTKLASYRAVPRVGQTLFMDLETNDHMNHILPVCYDEGCVNSYICVYANNMWHYLSVSFEQSADKEWGFPSSDASGHRYTDTITFRTADFNNDGYVDMLVTLQLKKGSPLNSMKTFLLENVPCERECSNLTRTFKVNWDALSPTNENAVMGAFYDFMQDGIMDVIFVKRTNNVYNVSAFQNSLDYDANFIKVMVISGITNTTATVPTQPLLGLGSTKSFFSSNLPGPKVQYKTTTQDGKEQAGRSSQLPQSAHFALFLPYTIFGLGRTPNFVEDLSVGMFNRTKQLSPIIPNSQLVIIIPDVATTNPAKWVAQLFVQPSKIILQTATALAGTCLVIAVIIGVLHWKERREDRMERLQQTHRFHM